MSVLTPSIELRSRPTTTPVIADSVSTICRFCLCLWLCLSFDAFAASEEGICRESDAGVGRRRPVLLLETAQGSIDIELFEAAAPRAMRRLADLIRGPIFNPDLASHLEATGFYDGLEFDSIEPHVEIVTSTRRPDGLFQLPMELDAGALGLDEDRVETSGEAMSVMQQELLVRHRELKKSGHLSPRLRSLVEKWYETYTPDFLIGITRQEINEALGYSYEKGLETRPVIRGSVALKPLSPQLSSARLSIALTDIPQRKGQWMVVGQVIDGLDVAEAISLLPDKSIPEPAAVSPWIP